jgi:malonate-semialdehyde dehydrogenase (acetylating)/methylmalonate-semialdehyde dehydrogenase
MGMTVDALIGAAYGSADDAAPAISVVVAVGVRATIDRRTGGAHTAALKCATVWMKGAEMGPVCR